MNKITKLGMALRRYLNREHKGFCERFLVRSPSSHETSRMYNFWSDDLKDEEEHLIAAFEAVGLKVPLEWLKQEDIFWPRMD